MDRLADVVDDVRIQHRHVAHRQVRRIEGPQAALLAGVPFLRAVGAEVHDGVRLELLAHPEIHRRVVVVHDLLGVVEQVLLLLGAAAAARRLRQDQELPELQARNHEARRALVGHQLRAALRRAPVRVHFRHHAGGQGLLPLQVDAQRQERPQVGAHQLRQGVRAVGRLEHLRHRVDHLLLLDRRQAVALGLEVAGELFQRARHVHVRRALVGLARRRVPEEQRDALVGVGHALQAGQVHRLAGQQVELFGQGALLAILVHGEDHRILDADVLGVGQGEGQAERVHPGQVGAVGRRVALVVMHHVEHRNAHRLVTRLAAFHIAAQEGVDQQHVGQQASLQAQQRLLGHRAPAGGLRVGEGAVRRRRGLRRATALALRPLRAVADARVAVEHQGHGAAGFQRGDGVVQMALLAVGQVAGRGFHGHHRQGAGVLAPRAAPPGQVGRQLAEQPVRRGRVVDRAIGQQLRFRHAGQIAALAPQAQVLEQQGAVRLHAAQVILRHAQADGLGGVDGAQAGLRGHAVDLHDRHVQPAQGLAGRRLDGRLVVGARRVDQHAIGPRERLAQAPGILPVHLHPGQFHALFPGGLLQQHQLVRQHELGGQQGDLDLGLRVPGQRQQGGQYDAE